MEMRGVLAGIGLIQGKPFIRDAATLDMLDKAARHRLAQYACALLSTNRHWINPLPTNASFTADIYNILDERMSFFTLSPVMAAGVENIGEKCPVAYVDADDNFLRGGLAYVLHLPAGIPTTNFWSVAIYDPITGSGLDNGRPFPSLSTMDKPIQNLDGSTDIYFGPKSPMTSKELTNLD